MPTAPPAFSTPTTPVPLLTGRSRKAAWHADLFCEIYLVWGWSNYSPPNSVGETTANPGGFACFDFWLTDQSYCDYLGIIARCTAGAATATATDGSGHPTQYSVSATVEIGYYDTDPFTVGAAQGPWILLQTVSETTTVNTPSVTIGPNTYPPGAFGWYEYLPQISATTWASVHVTLSGSLDYSVNPLLEAINPYTSATISGNPTQAWLYEVLAPGTTDTLTLTRQGGQTWTKQATYNNPSNAGYTIISGGSLLRFTQTSCYSTQLYGGFGNSVIFDYGVGGGPYYPFEIDPNGNFSDQLTAYVNNQADNFIAAGILLAHGCRATCGPLYTSDSPGQVNPVAPWGTCEVNAPGAPVMTSPGAPKGNGAAQTPKTYSGGSVNRGVGSGQGSSPHTVVVTADVIRPDGVLEVSPCAVDIYSGSLVKHLTTAATGTASWTYTVGGWLQLDTAATPQYVACSALNDQPVYNANSYSFPNLSVQAFYQSELAYALNDVRGLPALGPGSTSAVGSNQVNALGSSAYFRARMGHAFDSVRMTQPGTFQFLPAGGPPAVYNSTIQAGLPAATWYCNWSSSMLTASPDGAGNLRITVPTMPPAGFGPGIPGGALLILNNLSTTANVSGYRYLTFKHRSVGSANQPITFTITNGGTAFVIVSGTTGADGATASDGGWVTTTIDLLNPSVMAPVFDVALELGYNAHGVLPAIVSTNGVLTLQITGLALGTVYEFAGITGSIKSDVYGWTGSGAGYTLATDGVVSQYGYGSPGQTARTINGPASIQDLTIYLNQVNYNKNSPTDIPFWSFASLAAPTAGKTAYGPLSGLFQNDLPMGWIGGAGILDTGGLNAGPYRGTVLPVAAALDGSTNASLTAQAQICAVQVSLYAGCGDALKLDPSTPYGNVTHVRFSGQTRCVAMGTVYGAPPANITLTDTTIMPNVVGATTRAGSGFYYSGGTDSLLMTATQPAILLPPLGIVPGTGLGKTANLLSTAGVNKTAIFAQPFLPTPASYYNLGADYSDVIAQSNIPPLLNKIANNLRGPGGLTIYNRASDTFVWFYIYASVKRDHGPRAKHHPHGYLAVVRTDLVNDLTLWQRTAAKATPDISADWLGRVTVFNPASPGLLTPPSGATVCNADIMLDASHRWYAVFELDDASGNGTIYETYSDDDGATWNAPVSLGVGSNPHYGQTEAGGVGMRLPSKFVPGTSDPSVGTIVVYPTAAGQAVDTTKGVTVMVVLSAGPPVTYQPLMVTDGGFSITQGHEGPGRFNLLAYAAGDTVVSEWQIAHEGNWTATLGPTIP